MSTSRAQWTGVSFDYFVATFRNSYTMRVGDYFECEAHYRQGDRMPGWAAPNVLSAAYRRALLALTVSYATAFCRCLVYRSVAPTVTAAAGNAQGALSRTIMDKRPYVSAMHPITFDQQHQHIRSVLPHSPGMNRKLSSQQACAVPGLSCSSLGLWHLQHQQDSVVDSSSHQFCCV